MTNPKVWPYCQFARCQSRADYELVGRWTIFDWIEVYACLVHVSHGISYLQNRTVDGEPVAQIEQKALEAW